MNIQSVILTSILMALQSQAHAATCSMLSFNVDDASTKLNHAAKERNFDEAKFQAGRAIWALEEASQSAMDCKCSAAEMNFDWAATYTRRARDASDGQEYVYNLNRAIREYNSALSEIRSCAARARAR